MRILSLYVLIFLVYACEWPFDTDETSPDALLDLAIEHSITRLVDSSDVKLTWSEIIVENFSKVTVERRISLDTDWTLRAILTNPLVITYTDVVNDDADFQYRVTFSDVQGNEKWTEGETTIPRTTSLYIPDDYESIQAAFESPVIDDGDSILVSSGKYPGSLSILGKDILVRAIDDHEVTTIIASDSDRCLNINDGILEGVWLEGGTGGEGAYTPGGGVYAAGSAVLRNNFIVDNQAPGEGGGLYLTGNASLYNNIVFHNVGDNVGGIFISNATGEVINNTIVGNSIAGDSLGGVSIANSSVIFLNNIISEHTGFDLLVMDDAPASVVAYCRFKDADPTDSNGNIPDDPLFLEVANEDFHLRPDSPCTNTGHPGDEYQDNNGSQNDMGAYGGPYGE